MNLLKVFVCFAHSLFVAIIVDLGCSEVRGQPGQYFQYEQDLFCLFALQCADVSTSMKRERYDTFCRQASKRLAHRTAADAQIVGEVCLYQALPGYKPSCPDTIRNCFNNPVR